MSARPKQSSPNRAWVEKAILEFQREERQDENFELLFREYAPRVRSILWRQGWRQPDLDDLVQDVMIRVYKGLGGFGFRASFDTWLLHIMNNAAQNARRDRRTGKAKLLRNSLEGLLEPAEERGPKIAEPEHPDPDPLEETLSVERRGLLIKALDELPARTRQCFLFRYQGYKYREIAQAQGVSIETVKKQIGKGHRRLRPILGSIVELFSLLLSAALFCS